MLGVTVLEKGNVDQSMFLIPASRKQRQEDSCNVKASPVYPVRPCFRRKKRN